MFLLIICIYILGGLTFIPLAVGLVLLHAHLTFPHHVELGSSVDALRHSSDDDKNIQSDSAGLSKKLQRDREKDAAEGYFAVCREYVPGGINGKPPVRTTPAGQVIAEESPSVYQSMYRSLFDRRQVPSMDAGKVEGGKPAKRARNIFYVVLRHGHLILYDDSEQVEVRHVISLAHHNVSVYGGGNEIPEGELWIKRNAIRLSRKDVTSDGSSSTLPFFLFSDNCSDKEDFYFALLQSQENNAENVYSLPLVEHFELKHVISLVQRLHSSEEQLQTRWINTLIGRLFLAVYKTEAAEDFVRMKITKKIARVKKPAFLSGIILQKISLGEAAPFITNPRLKDLTVEGDCCVEADIKYDGNFRIEVAATARIDLGTRFKAREVNLVLAVVVKKLQGHLFIKFKPPPSNRVWLTFETMPLLEMSIEPIVSSRQITYGIILRAIESRIREVLAETIVLPHWDDSPFLSTTKHRFRGGIWVNDLRSSRTSSNTAIPDEVPQEEVETTPSTFESHVVPGISNEKPMSTIALSENERAGLVKKREHKSTHSLVDRSDAAASSGVQRSNGMPKAFRSRSFASAANPVTSTDNVNIEVAHQNGGNPKLPKDAASLMTQISTRSQPNSPLDTPSDSINPNSVSSTEQNKPSDFSLPVAKGDSLLQDVGLSQGVTLNAGELSRPASAASLGSKSTRSQMEHGTQQLTKLQSMARTLTPSEKKQQNIMSAANAAKNWGWNTISRKGKTASNSNLPAGAGTPDHPIGRGRPLPPPGQPLPRPDKRGIIPSMAIPKRKPVAVSLVPDREEGAKVDHIDTTSSIRRANATPGASNHKGNDLLIVQAPAESEPVSPIDDDHDGYGDFIDNVKIDDDEDDQTDTMNPINENGRLDYEYNEPQTSLKRHEPYSTLGSYDEDKDGLASWQTAQEEEARSKSFSLDELEHP